MIPVRHSHSSSWVHVIVHNNHYRKMTMHLWQMSSIYDFNNPVESTNIVLNSGTPPGEPDQKSIFSRFCFYIDLILTWILSQKWVEHFQKFSLCFDRKIEEKKLVISVDFSVELTQLWCQIWIKNEWEDLQLNSGRFVIDFAFSQSLLCLNFLLILPYDIMKCTTYSS